MFLSFDGVDGAGKSTQIRLCCEWLRAAGHAVVACRDPGTTHVGESLRKIVLEPSEHPLHRRSEMLIYMAARAQLVEEVIRPALRAGQTVISDRYLLANVVYQGHAGGLPVASLWSVGAVAVDGLLPDLTIILDIDPETAAKRQNRPPDRMEAQGLNYLRRVREGFLLEARERPGECFIVDASASVEHVQREIQQIITKKLKARAP